eukprot:NODE_126_length_18761_cov_0.476262.p4 type:complete len:294 gc:universal NODE_126_length_18761_cov_0.476262:12699-11818(-)
MMLFKKATSPEFKYLKNEWSEEMMSMFILHLDMSDLNLQDIQLKNYGNLRELNLSCNFLSELDIKWPSKLQILYLNGNNLRHMKNVPDQIQILGIAYNKIDRLCKMPESLKILDIRGNCISDINEFNMVPAGIVILHCKENPIELVTNIYCILQNKFLNAKINNKTYERLDFKLVEASVTISVKFESNLSDYIKSNKIMDGTMNLSIFAIPLDFDLDVKSMVSLQKKKDSVSACLISVPLKSLNKAYEILKISKLLDIEITIGSKKLKRSLDIHSGLATEFDTGLSMKLTIIE